MTRSAVVTGGASGIGKAIVVRLASQGYGVVIADIDHDGSLRVAGEIGNAQVLAVRADVRSPAQVEAAVRAAVDAFGALDVLVNDAGIYPARPFMDIDDAHWDEVFDTNVRGVVYCSQAALRVMMPRRSGRIVNIASVDGKTAGTANACYSASKAAVISLTHSLAREMAPYGILVNAIAPGWVGTKRVLEAGRWKDGVKDIPLGRLASPEEIADVVGFLCSDASRYMTGEVVNVNGGVFMD
ncbi:MAG: SDR family NAD(P)-dependent oxidoreductase [Ignavibacteriales bacterium]